VKQIKFKRPFVFGDYVHINKGFCEGDAVVTNYEASLLDDDEHPIDFQYSVLRMSDGQVAAWIDHDDITLIRTEAWDKVKEATKQYRKFRKLKGYDLEKNIFEEIFG